MPRLKILDTRQSAEEISVMSWSPKMDLLALGNNKGNVHLHRLSWQKVWQVSLTLKESPVVPELMTWHPEGLFLVVTSGETTFVIDVEGGKVVHNHEISFQITTARWCSSQFQHCTNEALSSHFRHQHHQTQRLESNLSILFLGTSNGYMYAYTGGFLLGLCIRIAEETTSLRILQVESTLNLTSFYFLSEDTAEGPSGKESTVMFSHLKNETLPKMAPVIRPLGLRYILFLKNWATVQAEFSSLGECWSKIVDLYQSYMTFGGTKDIEISRIDYLELALTGASSVEMELFMGNVGREKEAKKNINTINSATASIIEHIRTIKCSITNMLTELNEIGGFLRQVSEYEEANSILTEIRKAMMYFFLAILNMQGLVHNFVEIFLHFMNLILNTIHALNVQDLPDFIEEDADTDKVLEFLDIQIDKDVLNFMFTYVKLGYSSDEPAEADTPESTSTLPFSHSIFSNIMNPDGGTKKYRDFASFVHNLVKNSPVLGEHGHPLLLDYHEDRVKELVINIVPKVNQLTKSLLCIPVLCSVPFDADTFPVIRLPVDACSEKLQNRFQIFLDETTNRTYLSSVVGPKRLVLFEVDLANEKQPMLKSCLIHFNRLVKCFEIFTSSHMTVVTFEKKESGSESKEQELGRTIVIQIPFVAMIFNQIGIDVHSLKTARCGTKSSLPQNVYVDIPLILYGPCTTIVSGIDYALPIEGFSAISVAVSGARKVGAVLGEDKRTVVLLEMGVGLEDDSTMEEGEGCDEASTTEDED